MGGTGVAPAIRPCAASPRDRIQGGWRGANRNRRQCVAEYGACVARFAVCVAERTLIGGFGAAVG